MAVFMAGAKTSGALVANNTAPRTSPARPWADRARKSALAGATTSGRVRATESFTMHPNRGITINVGGTTATPLGGTIDVAAEKTLTVPGPIAGAGRLTKSGSGTLVLSGSSTYAGTTTVSTRYGRPWEGGEKDTWTFTAAVTVTSR